MKLKRGEEEEPVPNLTPMIDVVFQLLVFFMVATSFMDPEREIDIELPEANAGEPAPESNEDIIINVFADGRLVVSGEDLDAESLLRRLKAAAQHDPKTPVTIRGDGSAQHKDIVSVMAACEQAGLHSLSVGTLEGS